jgi:ATP-binding cassette subfamily B protein
MKFPHYNQFDKMDCGPTCIRMVAKYYGRNYSLHRLREMTGISRDGVSLLAISHAAEKIGFYTTGLSLSLGKLQETHLPAILHWKQDHFVVLHKIKGKKYYIADPAKAYMIFTEQEFVNNWIGPEQAGKSCGVLLKLQPSDEFYSKKGDSVDAMRFRDLFKYLRNYKKLIVQLFVGILLASMLQLILPFLTQSVVDIGIGTKNISFIYVILIAQIMLFLGRISLEFFRSWILLHISTRINVSILTDFLVKLMKLPMSFFDSRMTGDIMQRMNDQKRIETFLTSSTLTTVFSIFNLMVFGAVLAYYNKNIFLIFFLSSILYGLWIIFFLKKRKNLDLKRFDIAARNQSSMIQLINGMQEIKLNNCEIQKRWEWERIQVSLFQFSIRSLALGQYQQMGTLLINEGKNILITFMVATSVIRGELTLGAMMAIQYMIGQLDGPVQQMLGFSQQMQDAKLSLERLNEVRELDEEEPSNRIFIKDLPSDKSLLLENVSFKYPGVASQAVIENFTLHIMEGKTTAIVGMSGSGKTTVLKLLLRFYEPQSGRIYIGKEKFEQVSFSYWRSKCGVVMQDGFIFSDTIARNIAVGDESPEPDKLKNAIEVANLSDFISSLALGVETKIGAEGNGISQGQKQRILIARSIYKDPEYIFFDEATNSLDANNETKIMENLENFFVGKTVVVVAHRLSTVRNADHIVVLESGRIIESGTHDELVMKNGSYFELVKNQLELDRDI